MRKGPGPSPPPTHGERMENHKKALEEFLNRSHRQIGHIDIETPGIFKKKTYDIKSMNPEEYAGFSSCINEELEQARKGLAESLAVKTDLHIAKQLASFPGFREFLNDHFVIAMQPEYWEMAKRDESFHILFHPGRISVNECEPYISSRREYQVEFKCLNKECGHKYKTAKSEMFKWMDLFNSNWGKRCTVCNMCKSPMKLRFIRIRRKKVAKKRTNDEEC